MKKFTLTIISAFLMFHLSHAQYISLGLKAGAQLANINFEQSGIDNSGIVGFHGGAFFKLKSPAKFGGKIEVLYSTRGTDIQVPLAGETKLRTSYVDIPLLLTFNIIKPLAIELGPQASFFTGGTSEAGGTKTDLNDPETDPELGFAIGVDVNLPKKLGVYARYNMGFNKDAADNSVNNTWIQLGVKYRIFEPI